MDKRNYQGNDALMDWHNERTKSSLNEAFRTPEYASPITTFRSDAWLAFDFFVNAFIGFGLVVGCLFVVALLLHFVGVL